MTYKVDVVGLQLTNPIVIVNSYSGAAPTLKLDGATLVSGTDYLASYDTQGQRLWVTLLKTITTTARLQVN